MFCGRAAPNQCNHCNAHLGPSACQKEYCVIHYTWQNSWAILNSKLVQPWNPFHTPKKRVLLVESAWPHHYTLKQVPHSHAYEPVKRSSKSSARKMAGSTVPAGRILSSCVEEHGVAHLVLVVIVKCLVEVMFSTCGWELTLEDIQRIVPWWSWCRRMAAAMTGTMDKLGHACTHAQIHDGSCGPSDTLLPSRHC